MANARMNGEWAGANNDAQSGASVGGVGGHDHDELVGGWIDAGLTRVVHFQRGSVRTGHVRNVLISLARTRDQH